MSQVIVGGLLGLLKCLTEGHIINMINYNIAEFFKGKQRKFV